MNGIFNKSLCVILATGLSSIALTADVVGKWSGKMTLNGSVLRKQLVEQSSKLSGENKKQIDNRIRMIDESIKVVEKAKVKLDLKKGGVAFIEFTRNREAEPEWCKWSVSGKKVKLIGFSGGGNKMTLDGSLGDSGKSILFDMSFLIAEQMKMQGLKSASKPKLTLIFKKL